MKRIVTVFFILFLSTSYRINAQVTASGYGFNYFERVWVTNNDNGAGFSFYAGVWPIMQQYPGPEHFQLGLPSTWMVPSETGNEPDDFYNTIEGGLGWWGDTRFATETPKFIMGGVANGFSQWANGVGAGSSAMLPDGYRDWSVPGGKYGVAQLSKNLLWPPDGLNMEQGANGEFLGYGYHPLPLTDVMPETYGYDFLTGNQCWTLFLNCANFKGPITFFIPTFWTETALNEPDLEGLFLDTRPTDKNQAFAMEHAESPALIGFYNSETYARILPFVFPVTTENRSEVIRDVTVFTRNAKWDEVDSWFSGGTEPSTEFQIEGIENVFFNVNSEVDGNIESNTGNPIDGSIYYDAFAEKINNVSQTAAGFEWNTSVVDTVDGNFIMPEFYKLNQFSEWEPIDMFEVPASTGLLDNEPVISPNNNTPYLTPLEPDCQWQEPSGPWNNPGPSAGPFNAQLGDGTELTYYWYRFIDQPAIIHSNLPDTMRENLQDRVEQIHTHWLYTDSYLPNLNSGTLVGLDAALIVEPPAGMEIGYVPIVTRQELDATQFKAVECLNAKNINIYPNPFNPSTTFKFSIQNSSEIEISIYNIKGQKIKTLVNNEFQTGSHSVLWNGDNENGEPVSSGIYLYKLIVNAKTEAMKKCLLLK